MQKTPNKLNLILMSFLICGNALSNTPKDHEKNGARLLQKSSVQEEMEKVSFASGIRLMDQLFSRVGLKAAIKEVGLGGNSASQVEQVVRLSLKNLTGSENPTRQSLVHSLRGIRNGTDARVKDNLLHVLMKRESEMTNADFINAVNSLVYLAGRHGLDNSLALACSACVGGTLAEKGFLFSYKQVTDKQTNFILKNVIPANPADLSQFIKNRLSRLNMSAKASRYFQNVGPTDEKSFALFLSVPEHGSSSQKELFEAVKKISERPNGQVELIDSENSHKLWRLFNNDLNDAELQSWSRILNEIAADAKAKGEVNKKAAFYRYFEKRAKADPSLEANYQTLKRKDCFFK